MPRWELGPSISTIRLPEASPSRAWGFGGRGVLNVSKTFAADIQFARDTTTEHLFIPVTQRHIQFTANLKATWRPENPLKINPFALAGMGLARDGVSFGSPIPGTFYDNRFALRLGGGLEFRPRSRITVRLDISDLASRLPISGSRGSILGSQWWNRLDGSVSVMVGLGTLR